MIFSFFVVMIHGHTCLRTFPRVWMVSASQCNLRPFIFEVSKLVGNYLVGFLGRWIDPLQSLYLLWTPPHPQLQRKKERKTDTFIHASNCIRAHDHMARPVKGTTRVGCRGHPCFSVWSFCRWKTNIISMCEELMCQSVPVPCDHHGPSSWWHSEASWKPVTTDLVSKSYTYGKNRENIYA